MADVPTPPRNRPFLGAVLGAVAGLVLCGAGLFAVHSLNRGSGRIPAVAPVAQTFCSDLHAQDYNAAYQLLSPPLRNQGTETQFAASQQELDALSGKVTGCSPVVQQMDSTSATVQLAISREHASQKTSALHLTYSAAGWVIADFDNAVV